MEQGDRLLSIRESKAVRLGITIAAMATISLIALIAVGMVKGPGSVGPEVPTSTQQYLSQQQAPALTSFDFMQSSTYSEQVENDDYPRSTDGLALPQNSGQ
jgi:hypothetical protein